MVRKLEYLKSQIFTKKIKQIKIPLSIKKKIILFYQANYILSLHTKRIITILLYKFL